ncbi:MAG TPA: hypothetical protein VLW85_17740 [Myxococcales bacterium]|nr:hypothetical protein [Myxococcales bacterium]
MKRLSIVALCLAACSGTKDPVPAEQTIALDREPVTLPAAFVGTVQTESLQILNQGRADLTVTAVSLSELDGGPLPGADAGGFDPPLIAVDAGTISDPLPVKIGGLGAGFVQFSWGPKKAGQRTVQLTIDSDAPARPHIVTTVSGCAVPADGGTAGCLCADGGTGC